MSDSLERFIKVDGQSIVAASSSERRRDSWRLIVCQWIVVIQKSRFRSHERAKINPVSKRIICSDSVGLYAHRGQTDSDCQ